MITFTDLLKREKREEINMNEFEKILKEKPAKMSMNLMIRTYDEKNNFFEENYTDIRDFFFNGVNTISFFQGDRMTKITLSINQRLWISQDDGENNL
jgi:hypothetical protein